MSTKKTKNYQLHQWEATDDFLRTEFNENFTKLDAVLKTGLSGLEAGLGEKIGVVIGTYAGRQTTPEASTRRIELGFRPKMVLLASSESLSIGVLAIDQTVAGAKWVVIDDTGFTVYHGLYSTDLARYTYLYAAFC